ncbi:MAG: hypothetical protein U9R37_05840 [Campylobacterota bacterium]|nr:hypothetical protein [Campylobacterota bacterium]
MSTESFSLRLIKSKIFDMYVGTAFFATIIFFVLNASYFTSIEMMFGVIFFTIIFKGIANIMLSMNISLYNLDDQESRINFEKTSDNLESLVGDLAIKEAAVQSAKNIKNR